MKKFIANDPQFKEWVDVTQNSADSTKIQQTTVDRLSDVMNNVQRVGCGGVVRDNFNFDRFQHDSHGDFFAKGRD